MIYVYACIFKQFRTPQLTPTRCLLLFMSNSCRRKVIQDGTQHLLAGARRFSAELEARKPYCLRRHASELRCLSDSMKVHATSFMINGQCA